MEGYGAPSIDSVTREAAKEFEDYDVATPDREKVVVETTAEEDISDITKFMFNRGLEKVSVDTMSYDKSLRLTFTRG